MDYEDFYWRAYYDDGTTVDEYDPETAEHNRFRDLDIPRLRVVALIPQADHLPSAAVRIDPDTNHQRPIFFRRRAVSSSASAEMLATVTCLGMQMTVRGQNVKHLCFYFSDGSILQTDDYQAV